MGAWYNDDGLEIRFGRDIARETSDQMAKVKSYGAVQTMVVDINYDNLPAFTVDRNNDGTNDGFSGADVFIPSGSYITRATLIVETAFTSAGATTLDIGLAQADGTVIDLDGIDAVIAKAALGASAVVLCNGALVGGTASIGANDAYLYTTVTTGPFTAGKAKLVIEYIPVDV